MNPVLVLGRLTRFTALYTLLCLMFSIVTFVLVPLSLGFATLAFFDAVSSNRIATGLALAAGIAAIYSVNAMASPAFGNPWSPMQQKAQALIRRNLFDALLRDYGRHPTHAPAGDIVSRMRDDPQLIADNLDAMCDLIGRSLLIIVAGVVMWEINPLITFVVALPLAFCSVFTRLMGGRISAYRRAARISTGEVSAFLGDLMAGQLAVKASGATGNVLARLEHLGHLRRQRQVRDTVFGAALEGINLNVGNVGTGLMLLLGAAAISRGRLHGWRSGHVCGLSRRRRLVPGRGQPSDWGPQANGGVAWPDERACSRL